MKRPVSAPSDSRPMTRRAAQALAAIVFLADRNKSQTPNIVALGSLLATRKWIPVWIEHNLGSRWGWKLDDGPGAFAPRRIAKYWLDYFSQLDGYFTSDLKGTELISQRLLVDQNEADTILDLHRVNRKLQTANIDIFFTAIVRSLVATVQPGDPSSLQVDLAALRRKGYAKKDGDDYSCTPKAEYQLPYLRILARNFQSTRRRIVSK